MRKRFSQLNSSFPFHNCQICSDHINGFKGRSLNSPSDALRPQNLYRYRKYRNRRRLAIKTASSHSRVSLRRSGMVCKLLSIELVYGRVAEWQSMAKREELLGYRTSTKPAGLVYPVVFFDGEHFPPEAKRIQSCDLSRWSHSYPSFRETQDFIDFTEEVKTIAEEIWGVIKNAPSWQPGWPVVLPDLKPHNGPLT